MQTANDLNKWAELLSTYFVPLEANIGTPDDDVSGSPARFFFRPYRGASVGFDDAGTASCELAFRDA